MNTDRQLVVQNSNVIARGAGKKLWRDVESLFCIHCQREVAFNTETRFYLLNRHGWGFHDVCLKMINQIDKQKGGEDNGKENF